jgi:hypothetical protein
MKDCGVLKNNYSVIILVNEGYIKREIVVFQMKDCGTQLFEIFYYSKMTDLLSYTKCPKRDCSIVNKFCRRFISFFYCTYYS